MPVEGGLRFDEDAPGGYRRGLFRPRGPEDAHSGIDRGLREPDSELVDYDHELGLTIPEPRQEPQVT